MNDDIKIHDDPEDDTPWYVKVIIGAFGLFIGVALGIGLLTIGEHTLDAIDRNVVTEEEMEGRFYDEQPLLAPAAVCLPDGKCTLAAKSPDGKTALWKCTK